MYGSLSSNGYKGLENLRAIGVGTKKFDRIDSPKLMQEPFDAVRISDLSFLDKYKVVAGVVGQ